METDTHAIALVKDLKQRMGREFGRASMSEIPRPDVPNSIVRPSFERVQRLDGGAVASERRVVGRTDELALNIVEDKVHVHDLPATMLYCLGMDHKCLTFRHQGRDYPLTEVGGE